MTDAPDITTPDTELSRFIGYNLKRALSVVQTDLGGVLDTFRLRAVSYSALMVVVRQPGINQSDLAETLGIERSNLVQIIDELAGRDLLLRSPVPEDRRRHALIPTDLGRNLASMATRAVTEHEERVFRNLSRSERAKLIALLQRIWDARSGV